MSMTTGALPFGPLEEDGWEAAGWKANLVRSMVGAEVPLDEVGAEVPLEEVKEAGRRRFMARLRHCQHGAEGGKTGPVSSQHGMLTAAPAHRHATWVSMLLCTVALVHFSHVILPTNPDHLDLHHSLTHDQAIDSPPNHGSAADLRGSRAIALSVHVQVAHQRAQFLHLTLEPSDGSQNLRLNLRLGVQHATAGNRLFAWEHADGLQKIILD